MKSEHVLERAFKWLGSALKALTIYARYFALLSVSLNSSLSAQETGTLLTHRPASVNGSSKADARRTTREFGTCSVSKAPTSAERFVELPVSSPEFERSLTSVAGPDCLGGGELHIPRAIMRGSLFEALYVRHFNRSGPTSFEKVGPIDYTKGYEPPYRADASNAIALAQIGDCVSRADGADAKRLILSIPESAQEDSAIAGLVSYLGPCVIKDQKVTFSRSVIRAAVAEGLYRLSNETSKGL